MRHSFFDCQESKMNPSQHRTDSPFLFFSTPAHTMRTGGGEAAAAAGKAEGASASYLIHVPHAAGQGREGKERTMPQRKSVRFEDIDDEPDGGFGLKVGQWVTRESEGSIDELG
jgi:hypothetical protein